jgi:hypothetical protein
MHGVVHMDGAIPWAAMVVWARGVSFCPVGMRSVLGAWHACVEGIRMVGFTGSVKRQAVLFLWAGPR